jgi:hypothetical protein
MTWLRATPLLLTLTLAACSNGDSSNNPGGIQDASQPPPTKFEAGSACATSNDCATGLVCLHPATTCQAFSVCVAPPPNPCDHPQTACSCLGENVQVCDGYSVDPIDTLTPCADSGVVPVVDAGGDATSATDTGTGTDASDAGATDDASDASDAASE